MENSDGKIPIELNKLVVKVYNSVALWNNQDGTPEQKQISLKLVASEIVTMVLNDAFGQINGIKTSETIEAVVPQKEEKKGIFSKWKKDK